MIATRVDLRVGGGAPGGGRTKWLTQGRSPRGRRSRQSAGQPRRRSGSISAWAEEPSGTLTGGSTSGVDLRVGGGANRIKDAMGSAEGRSPRGRRSHAITEILTRPEGSISAWAEEPAGQDGSWPIARVDLRVGGGAFHFERIARKERGRSPRGRRSLHREIADDAELGSISAWAEEPSALLTMSLRNGVDLRVGGGALVDAPADRHVAGRSPRGRRSLGAADLDDADNGSISAWAEEPPSA